MRTRHAVAKKQRRKNIFSLTKGFWGKRKNVYRRAIETLRRGLVFAYRDRRNKKREFRALWITRINAAARSNGTTYSSLINDLKKKNILLSRDMLALIAAEDPAVFAKIAQTAKS